MQSQNKHVIAFDTRLKIALVYVVTCERKPLKVCYPAKFCSLWSILTIVNLLKTIIRKKKQAKARMISNANITIRLLKYLYYVLLRVCLSPINTNCMIP